MQKFKKINQKDSVFSAVPTINDSFDTLLSNHAGVSFPVKDLVIGMECYREDLKKKYILVQTNPIVWQECDGCIDLSGKNLKDVLTIGTGRYKGNGVEGAPDTGWWYYEVMRHDDFHGNIIAYAMNDSRVYRGYYIAADNSVEPIWSGWSGTWIA